MNELQLFNYEGQELRTVLLDDVTWWVAKDVCKILGISKYRDAIRQLDEDERMSVLVDTLGGHQEMAAVNESGLYHLIFQSRKPDAKKFRKWVTSEVIPAIRKTGSYTVEKSESPEEGIVRNCRDSKSSNASSRCRTQSDSEK